MFICRPKIIPVKAGSRVGFTLLSDLHIGSADIDENYLRNELKEAADRNDRIAINGDVMDLILPKDHKRFSPDGVHPRLLGRKDLANAQAEMAQEFLAPYVNQIDMIGVGNHETAAEKWHSTDIAKLVIQGLRERVRGNHLIHFGGYTGFLDYRFRASNNEYRWLVYYHHGTGGDAPVTGGQISLSRKSVWVDADTIWLGHTHHRTTRHIRSVTCPRDGYQPHIRDVRLIITGSYFDTYHGQTQEEYNARGRKANYAEDAGLAPQGKGGAWVCLTFDANGYRVQVTQ